MIRGGVPEHRWLDRGFPLGARQRIQKEDPMSTRPTFLVVLAVFALAACAAPPAEGPAVDVAAEAQAIRDASMTWMQAAQARWLIAVGRRRPT